MLRKFKADLFEKCGITPGTSLLAGVSGGPDSLCMLHLLHQLGFTPVVAHLDHQLRPESKLDAQFVQDVAAGMKLHFVCQQQDVRSISQVHRLTLEEGARMARYQFLFQAANQTGAQAVVVGHTADDQVETVLLHMLRGAGIAGLSGMRYRSLPNTWSERIPLVRPLLGIWRKNIWEYLNANGLVPKLDLSNQDVNILRNRLRHQLIPALEKYNPNVQETLWHMADILRGDDQILQEIVRSAWDSTQLAESEDSITFNFQALKNLPIGLQRRVFQKAFSQLHPEFNEMSFQTIERAVDFLRVCLFNDQIELVKGLEIVREADTLMLATGAVPLPGSPWPEVGISTPIHLPVPGRSQLSGEWLISAEEINNKEEIWEKVTGNKDHFQTWLDLDLLEVPLLIRSRLPGDHFQPLGMSEGSIKISDAMINIKLPQRLRRHWPLILSGSTIAWIPGFQPGHGFRLTPQTTRIANLRIETTPGDS